jgi:hypothetical protein
VPPRRTPVVLKPKGNRMISRATFDAAARVAEYAARRPITLSLSVVPMLTTGDAPIARANGQVVLQPTPAAIARP